MMSTMILTRPRRKLRIAFSPSRLTQQHGNFVCNILFVWCRQILKGKVLHHTLFVQPRTFKRLVFPTGSCGKHNESPFELLREPDHWSTARMYSDPTVAPGQSCEAAEGLHTAPQDRRHLLPDRITAERHT